MFQIQYFGEFGGGLPQRDRWCVCCPCGRSSRPASAPSSEAGCVAGAGCSWGGGGDWMGAQRRGDAGVGRGGAPRQGGSCLRSASACGGKSPAFLSPRASPAEGKPPFSAARWAAPLPPGAGPLAAAAGQGPRREGERRTGHRPAAAVPPGYASPFSSPPPLPFPVYLSRSAHMHVCVYTYIIYFFFPFAVRCSTSCRRRPVRRWARRPPGAAPSCARPPRAASPLSPAVFAALPVPTQLLGPVPRRPLTRPAPPRPLRAAGRGTRGPPARCQHLGGRGRGGMCRSQPGAGN